MRLGRARCASSRRLVRSEAQGAAQDDACFGCLFELVRGFTRGSIIDALESLAEAGREPGEMPAEVIVYAIEAADVETFGEELGAS